MDPRTKAINMYLLTKYPSIKCEEVKEEPTRSNQNMSTMYIRYGGPNIMSDGSGETIHFTLPDDMKCIFITYCGKQHMIFDGFNKASDLPANIHILDKLISGVS